MDFGGMPRVHLCQPHAVGKLLKISLFTTVIFLFVYSPFVQSLLKPNYLLLLRRIGLLLMLRVSLLQFEVPTALAL